MILYSGSKDKIQSRNYFRDQVVRKEDIVLMTTFPDYYDSKKTQEYIKSFEDVRRVFIVGTKDISGFHPWKQVYNLKNSTSLKSDAFDAIDTPIDGGTCTSCWIDLEGSLSESNMLKLLKGFDGSLREAFITYALSRRSSCPENYPFANSESTHDFWLNTPTYLPGDPRAIGQIIRTISCDTCSVCRIKNTLKGTKVQLAKYWECASAGTSNVTYANIHLTT